MRNSEFGIIGARKCAKKNNVEKSEFIIPVCPWANREGDRSSLDKFQRYKNFGWYISVLMMYGRNGGGLPHSLFTSLMRGVINFLNLFIHYCSQQQRVIFTGQPTTTPI